MRKQKVSLTIPDDYVAKVDEIAEQHRRSRSFIIAEAIEKYLENDRVTPNQAVTAKHKKGVTR
jgi:predicted transcriptional regulator